MIPKSLERITATDLHNLVAAGSAESRTLEFKREIPGRRDDDKRELCADVSAFANSNGGDLLFGVAESDGAASEIIGIDRRMLDEERLRLDQVIRSGIDPEIPGLRLHAVSIDEDRAVLVCRIPMSWRAPHLVLRPGQSFRMFARTDAGKVPVDAQGIRLAFAGSGDLSERIKTWREERIAAILSDRGAIPVTRQVTMVMHIAPLAAFRDRHQINAGVLRDHKHLFAPIVYSSDRSRINVDGLLNYRQSIVNDGRTALSYCQVFRNGCIEGVNAEACGTHDDTVFLPSHEFEHGAISFVQKCLEGLAAVGVAHPFAVSMSFLNAQGVQIGISTRLTRELRPSPMDRDVLLLPDVMLETSDDDPVAALRPLIDSVWNACGVAASPNFNEHGQWKPVE